MPGRVSARSNSAVAAFISVSGSAANAAKRPGCLRQIAENPSLTLRHSGKETSGGWASIQQNEPSTDKTLVSTFTRNLTPDKKYRFLLGGSASAKTGNFAAGDIDGHEEFKRLHYEWEQGTLPFFAWPTEGDRVTLWGSWIWDCGHFTTKGKVTGERTEFHPLNALVVNRRNSYRAKPGESETNVFISSDGNYAHAEEECALSHHPDPNDPGKYDAGYRACVQAAGHEQQPLEGKYSFFVPAPPKPSPGATLSYRTKSDVKSTPATEKIKVKSNGLSVSVSLKSLSGGKTRRFGRSYFLHWTGAQPSSTTLKISVLALIPAASSRDAVAVNTGLFIRRRAAKRRSRRNSDIGPLRV